MGDRSRTYLEWLLLGSIPAGGSLFNCISGSSFEIEGRAYAMSLEVGLFKPLSVQLRIPDLDGRWKKQKRTEASDPFLSEIRISTLSFEEATGSKIFVLGSSLVLSHVLFFQPSLHADIESRPFARTLPLTKGMPQKVGLKWAGGDNVELSKDDILGSRQLISCLDCD